MADDVRRIEAEVLRSLASGDEASRAVYSDWLEEHGEEEPDRLGPSADDFDGADAVPMAHDEVFRGVYLFERLTQLRASIRHNPTNTTWVFVYRGLWKGLPVILFRAAPWLRRPGFRVSNVIIKDVGDRAIASFTTSGADGAALVEAPPGIRLRALTLALIAREERIPHPVIFDLVRRTAQQAPQCDTFIAWDGSLWFSPRFERSWQSEMPSANGDEVFDGLVLDSPAALGNMLAGLPAAMFSTEPAVIHPSQRSPDLAVLLDEPDPGRFVRLCVERATEPAEHCARWLADQLRRLFPEAYANQCAALATVGLDIEKPWQPRRQERDG